MVIKMNDVLQVRDLRDLLDYIKTITTTTDKKWRSRLINGNNLKPKNDMIPIEWWWFFNMRPREALANRLLCAVFQSRGTKGITFQEDSNWDGIILDRETWKSFPVEHVSALHDPVYILPSWEDRIIDAINKKIAKKPPYPKWTHLVVFFDGAGEWYRNKVRENIKWRHDFEMVYCIGLMSKGWDWYAYSVTQMPPMIDNSFTFKVQFNPDFTDWTVSQIP